MEHNRQINFSGGGIHEFSLYQEIISSHNILKAWKNFRKNKRSKKSIQEFEFFLESYILSIIESLENKKYTPLPYNTFSVYDPKKRHIHAAQVKDRVVQQSLFQVIEPIFDKYFIYDSYSCRKHKGTLKALNRFRVFIKKESRNNTQICWVLKCDIRKFFDSIDHGILKQLLRKHIADRDTLELVDILINSFEKNPSKGLPLGNVISQLFGNIYMHVFDHYIKHTLNVKYYIRYCDDFVFVHREKKYLENLIPRIQHFLQTELCLELHPKKVEIKKVTSGVDFLGWVHFPHHRVLRTATKRRMVRKLAQTQKKEVVESYRGMLSHGDAYKLRDSLKD